MIWNCREELLNTRHFDRKDRSSQHKQPSIAQLNICTENL